MDFYSKESSGIEIEVQWQATQSTGNPAWDKLLQEARTNRTTEYQPEASTSKQTLNPDIDSPSRLSFFTSSVLCGSESPSSDKPRARRSLTGRPPPRRGAPPPPRPSDPKVLKGIIHELNKIGSVGDASFFSSTLSSSEEISDKGNATPTEPSFVTPLQDANGKGKGKVYSLPQVMDMSMEDVSLVHDSNDSTIMNDDRSRSRTSFASSRVRSTSTSTHQVPVAGSSRGKLQRHTSHPGTLSMFSATTTEPAESQYQFTYQNDLQMPTHAVKRAAPTDPPPKPLVRMHPLLVQQSQAQSQSHERSSPSVHRGADPPYPSTRPSTSTSAYARVHSTSTSSTTSASRTQAPTSHRAPARSSFTTHTRAPALGMRRTHTYPSPFQHSTLSQSQNLPTRQRGFRPPLAGSTQQRRRTGDAERLKAIEEALKEANQGQIFSQRQQPHQPAESQGGTESCSSTGGKLRRSVSTSGTSVEEVPSKVRTKVRKTKERKREEKKEEEDDDVNMDIPSCETTDPDSSFGDISFDMDALEETMKMYD